MIHVAVAVVRNTSGEVLLSKRPDHVHQGGLWEFPGGKIEPGESVESALQRELNEELGIQAEAFEPLISIAHQYSDKAVVLNVWEISAFSGLPTGREGQPIVWVKPQQLASRTNQATQYPLPKANFAIVKAITLASSMAVSGIFNGEADFYSRLKLAIQRGAKLFQCRLPELSADESFNLIATATEICHSANVQIILNTHFNNRTSEDVDGYHLTSQQLWSIHNRADISNHLVGASCHSAQDIQRAVDLDLDYVTLSPVQATSSHPKIESLGWNKFKTLSQTAGIPVFALGGVSPKDIVTAKANGGQGIAAISAFWNV
jgi:8-oxo-dGTP diphosphatase